jgi:hypothetical protein
MLAEQSCSSRHHLEFGYTQSILREGVSQKLGHLRFRGRTKHGYCHSRMAPASRLPDESARAAMADILRFPLSSGGFHFAQLAAPVHVHLRPSCTQSQFKRPMLFNPRHSCKAWRKLFGEHFELIASFYRRHPVCTKPGGFRWWPVPPEQALHSPKYIVKAASLRRYSCELAKASCSRCCLPAPPVPDKPQQDVRPWRKLLASISS